MSLRTCRDSVVNLVVCACPQLRVIDPQLGREMREHTTAYHSQGEARRGRRVFTRYGPEGNSRCRCSVVPCGHCPGVGAHGGVMFGRKRVPVLRLDKLGLAGRNLASSGVPAVGIQYTWSSDPEAPHPLASWGDMDALLQSLGSGPERVGVRFARPVGDRRVSAEAFGSARLDRLFLRWSDSGLKSRTSPPWRFTVSAPTGKTARVPLGDVAANFDELSPDAYEQFPGLDLAAVPAEAVVPVGDAAVALRWFLTTWPEESTLALHWIPR